MINIFVGKPGFGKTYSLVKLAREKIMVGRDVYSNFFIDQIKLYETIKLKNRSGLGRIYFWRNVEQIIKIKQGEILMDEAQIYMNSRKWKMLPEEVQYKLQQHRKHGVNIWGAVQNVKRVDTVCRELVNSVFSIKRVGSEKHPLFFIALEFDIEDIDKAKRKSLSTKIYRLNKRIAACYDTLQEIPYT